MKNGLDGIEGFSFSAVTLGQQTENIPKDKSPNETDAWRNLK